MRRRTAVPVLALLGLTFLATLPGWMSVARGPEDGSVAPNVGPGDRPRRRRPRLPPPRLRAQRGPGRRRHRLRGAGPGFRLGLGSAEAAIDLPGTPLRLRLVGSNPASAPTADDLLPTRTNYLVGDPSAWRTGVPSYGRVTYDDVYPGVDLVFFGNQRRLEHDFVVAPGADPGVVAFEVTGGDHVAIDSAGDLVVTAPRRRHRRPPGPARPLPGRRRRAPLSGGIVRPA